MHQSGHIETGLPEWQLPLGKYGLTGRVAQGNRTPRPSRNGT